ncbi:enoyl-CoA hydratase/isomerase family protein [Henriciella aquimarina]|uniref:enoyl-CoA hydratase/isomerase family protein n=1 Tax=Henriciella aquimarina TaxID=545261 RepID=UPI000A063EAA|nr:enoyl-CoA hydratase-related protein [Henriciella aquimarina]
MTEPAATDLIHLRHHGHAAEIVFNAPARRNAFSQAMWAALPGLIAKAEAMPDASAVILHGGETGHFAAGADISEFETIYADETVAAESAETIEKALTAIESCSKPVIAAIEGACVGGGVSIALAADLRISSEAARFGVTPARLGLVYPVRDTERLVHAVGPSQAKDILFTGAIFEAERARQIGLVDAVCEAGQSLAAAHEKAATIAANAPSSVRAMKEIVNRIAQGETISAQESRGVFVKATAGADFREGYRAFLDKRRPDFASD